MIRADLSGICPRSGRTQWPPRIATPVVGKNQANWPKVALDTRSPTAHSHIMGRSTIFDQLAADNRRHSSVIRDLLIHARQPGVISLAGGLPASELLPCERFAVATDRVLGQRGSDALQYGLSAGEPELREILVRDAEPDPERIVITTGAQQALDLVARLLSTPGRGRPVAVMEDPGYVGAVQVLRSHQFDLVGIGVDADGLRVEELAARLDAGLRPRLCYVNPTFQNPTGATLSAARARHLVELAERHDFLIVADDPYVGLALDGDTPPGLPSSTHVVRLGSTSKVISPGLRVGWLDADPRLATEAVRAKQAADLHTATFNQLVVAELMADRSWWHDHGLAGQDRYRMRRAALAEAVARHLPQAVLTPQRGGFFLWADLGVSVAELLPMALRHGVAFVPGSAFAVDQAQPNAVRLSYSSGDPADFASAVVRLSTAMAEMAANQSASPAG